MVGRKKCVEPKGMVVEPFRCEIGYRFQPFWTESLKTDMDSRYQVLKMGMNFKGPGLKKGNEKISRYFGLKEGQGLEY